MCKKLLKFVSVLAATLLLLIAVACKSEYLPAAVDEEAEAEAKAFWARAFSQCGDSHFGKVSSIIFEFKDPVILTYHKMDDRIFTEADKLNGIEWEGATSFSSKAYRYYRDGKWSIWVDYTPINFHHKLYLPTRKVKGNWEFGKPNDEKFVAVPCDQIPK